MPANLESENLGLERLERDELLWILTSEGRERSGCASESRLHLDAGMRADEAVKMIHKNLLGVIRRRPD